MESLPQVSAALEHVLTIVADEAASAVGFIRRRRVLTGALFVQALVLGFLARPAATLHHLTQTVAARHAFPAFPSERSTSSSRPSRWWRAA